MYIACVVYYFNVMDGKISMEIRFELFGFSVVDIDMVFCYTINDQ